ncbi:hypothetical protein TNCV_4231011 [Trichonephila clavipes]|uniref:Uncharacterized protein n=1 Tax=Trichonephila clavipes TaxID=2585209 RepID=A0A8X6VB05_TRICX|nr:hypothetical protein TNCV_4231011 [Trichonephila clavipes]
MILFDFNKLQISLANHPLRPARTASTGISIAASLKERLKLVCRSRPPVLTPIWFLFLMGPRIGVLPLQN